MHQEKHTDNKVAALTLVRLQKGKQTEGSGCCMQLYQRDSSKGLSYRFEKFLRANF